MALGYLEAGERMALLLSNFQKLVLILKGPFGFVPKHFLWTLSFSAPGDPGLAGLANDPGRGYEPWVDPETKASLRQEGNFRSEA